MKGTVLVTGASGGIGLAIARQLCGEGWRVYGTSRRPKAAQTPEGIRMLALDVIKPASIMEALRVIEEEAGGLDALINNAGMGIAGPLAYTEPRDACKQMAPNFFGALEVTRQALPLLRRAEGGRVICISSLAACIPIPYQALYSASKAALEITMQAWAMECAGVRFTCLELGDMHTDFTGHRQILDAPMPEAERLAFRRSLAKMEEDERHGMPPERAAAQVSRLLGRRNPPLVSQCGVGARTVALLRRTLPLGWSHRIIRMLYSK